jgi:hypothetical protein
VLKSRLESRSAQRRDRVTADGAEPPDNAIPLMDDHQEHEIEISISMVRSLM